MEASVGEPFILSSYTTTKKASKSSKSSGKLPSVFASHHRAGGSSEGHVTVAVQSDGVHVLDLSTLHPIISHTLGPTTTFACPSVTRSELHGANHVCTTYAAISSSPDISEDEHNRTIWMWKEDLSSSVADRAAQKKKVVALPHSISGLYIDEELPSRVLVTSLQGDMTILHGDLQIQATHTSKCESLRTFVLSQKKCAFLSSEYVRRAAVIAISLVSSNGNVRIQVLAVDSEDQFHELGDIELPVKSEAFCDISFDGTGFFSILLKNGTWSSFELKSTNDSIYLNSLESIQLTSLSFITTSNDAETSVVSLGSSHVLLAGFTGSASSREIVVLFWDLSFSVLLASRTLPLPPNLHSDKVSITLVSAPSSSNILLLLSPTSSNSDRRQSQSHSPSSSSVWVVPVTVPPSSSIASAIGRAAAAMPWLAVADRDDDPYDTEKTKLLRDMRSAMDRNRPENANDVFFEWETQAVSRDSSSKDEVPHATPLYGYNFTKEILDIVLQPSKPPKTPYSSKIIQHLLGKKVISTGMVEAGLLSALRLRNDWKSICAALTRVSDLQEIEIVECLCYVLARYRQARRGVSVDAMQVDSAPNMEDDTPTLQAFLRLVLGYNLSLIPLRVAFRRYLSDVDDVVCLLEVLDAWVGQWAGRDTRLLPSNRMLKKNELGVLIMKSESQEGQTDIPSMLQITSFLQCLIDTSFLNLIQTPSAHRILRRIQSHIDPEIKHIDQTEQLRGPLEIFAKAQAKAIKEAKAASEGVKVPPSDLRQRKKLLREQAGAVIGLYQLEELTL
ncbi:hypothetical protein J3R30DRAFT_3473899 [Lentinula aciculospora]|uniref:Uncharacterized protein n=1 Tax=Lentinula aciculospora TaxID=153920 RepID=A0A9W9ACU5_9AGAR|nr:hypothetical protein J3R30DRAFT_3473899 [Lentinula aciculospora]